MPAPRGEVAAYLDHDLLLATLADAGADAVWPGWGFVAEDPAFADRARRRGHPLPRTVRRGDAAARRQDRGEAARRTGRACRCRPGAATRWTTRRRPHVLAERIGYPLVVKAAAGGGGRGIRVVERPSELAEAFRSAGSEARSAFGDGRLFIERKITGGRHVEVQIARDLHGNTRRLRLPRLLGAAPPPEGDRGGAAAGARAAAAGAAGDVGDRGSPRASDYVGVGTVEFLVAGESFFFLEINPRLQVEHGVTETLTGVDLVQLQIRIARGESIAGVAVVERGAAIEARVCAEDPAAGFLPTPGRVARFDPALGPRVRVDTGVVAGNVIPAAFDSLIAKVIASGDTRDEARARLVCGARATSTWWSRAAPPTRAT